jgi:hypothetical protein
MNKSHIEDSAISFEGKKIALRQSKDGMVMLISIHPDDIPANVVMSRLGTRYQCVLFEIGDDENLVVPDDVRTGKKAVAVAGQMCREESFQNWLLSKHEAGKDGLVHPEQATIECLQSELGIESRSELKDNTLAQDQFRNLIIQYRKDTADGKFQ